MIAVDLHQGTPEDHLNDQDLLAEGAGDEGLGEDPALLQEPRPQINLPIVAAEDDERDRASKVRAPQALETPETAEDVLGASKDRGAVETLEPRRTHRTLAQDAGVVLAGIKADAGDPSNRIFSLSVTR